MVLTKEAASLQHEEDTAKTMNSVQAISAIQKQSMVGFDGPLLLATVYRAIYGVAASYVIAWLAPDRPMAHALVGGVLGLAAGILGAILTWNKGPAFGPHWYPIALIVLAMPQAWVGGQLRVMQSRVRVDA